MKINENGKSITRHKNHLTNKIDEGKHYIKAGHKNGVPEQVKTATTSVESRNFVLKGHFTKKKFNFSLWDVCQDVDVDEN